MNRNSCPHCQKDAMSILAKMTKLMITPAAKLLCQECGQPLHISRTAGLIVLFPGIGLAKFAESVFSFPQWGALLLAIAVMMPIYGYMVRFSVPSNKHEGIEW
jgi:hypothetical protein